MSFSTSGLACCPGSKGSTGSIGRQNQDPNSERIHILHDQHNGCYLDLYCSSRIDSFNGIIGYFAQPKVV